MADVSAYLGSEAERHLQTGSQDFQTVTQNLTPIISQDHWHESFVSLVSISMKASKLHLTQNEIARPFSGDQAQLYPAVLSPQQLALLLGKSVKTIYDWMAKGRLDGSYRKRGKHVLIWRDRALDIIFNGKDWNP